jgi:hypothetical protein
LGSSLIIYFLNILEDVLKEIIKQIVLYKNCNFKNEEPLKIDTNMIIGIIKENQEIKKLLIEQNIKRL